MEKKNTIQKVANYITKHQLIKEGQMVLVACSGGSDSMTLVDILLKLDIPISLAHCNFKLRGAESDSDEVFIKEFAKQKKLKIYLNTFDTKLYAKQQKISIEMAARKLRYDWFSDILLKNGIKIVATAHHEADKIETIILNFTKGSGLKGMQALQAKKGNVIRPLLELKKEEILAYIQDRKLLYRNDVSNLDIHFQRNRIRHEIIPNIRQINPNYSAAILQWDKIGRECEQMIQYIIDEKFKADFESNGRIDIKSLKELKFRGLILYYLLYPLGFHGDTIVEIEKGLNKISGKKFESKSHQLIKDRTYLWIEKIIETNFNPIFINSLENTMDIGIGSLVWVKAKKVSKIMPDEIYINKQCLIFPLKVRTANPGDFFYPFGMEGKKKLKDYFTNIKLNLFEKKKIRILENGNGGIIWVIGHRSDRRFAVDRSTKSIIKCKLT